MRVGRPPTCRPLVTSGAVAATRFRLPRRVLPSANLLVVFIGLHLTVRTGGLLMNSCARNPTMSFSGSPHFLFHHLRRKQGGRTHAKVAPTHAQARMPRHACRRACRPQLRSEPGHRRHRGVPPRMQAALTLGSW